jgi:hypothetical protein
MSIRRVEADMQIAPPDIALPPVISRFIISALLLKMHNPAPSVTRESGMHVIVILRITALAPPVIIISLP